MGHIYTLYIYVCIRIYIYIYMIPTVSHPGRGKKKKNRDIKGPGVVEGRLEGEIGVYSGFLGKRTHSLTLQWWIHATLCLSRPVKCPPPRVNPQGNN